MPSSPRPVDPQLARVGVVIVSFNSADVIGAALDALPRAELGGVVVVDNASVDESRRVVAERDHVQLLPLPENVGYGRGCNAGAAELPGCKYLLFLNPDAVISVRDLRLLVDWLDAHDACALVGPRLFRAGLPLPSAGALPGPWRLLRLVAPQVLHGLQRPWRFSPEFDHPGPVGYVEGACFLVRRASLEQAGGFDPRYFLFFEEMDLARRLAPQWTVDLCPAARAEHAVAASRKSVIHGARPELLRSAACYVDRWYGERRGHAFRVAARMCLRLRRGRGLAREAPAMLEALRSR